LILSIFCVADASNISAGDLENIIETETPPQSPPASEAEPLVGGDISKYSNNGFMRRRIARETLSELVFLSNSPEGIDNLNSPLSSQPSSPMNVPKPSSPPSFRALSSRLPGELDQSLVSVESYIQRQQDQASRIAEYQKRDSLISTGSKTDVS
jgi:hypothetical protein